MIFDFFLVFDVFFISGMGPAKSIAFPYNRAAVGGQDKKGIPEAEKLGFVFLIIITTFALR
jgi:hypothetical protein